MTFMHKLSYRLALLKDRLPIAMVMLLAMATVFACERPVAVTGPGGGTISHLVISPKTLTLHPNATADFTAVAFLDTGDSASVTVSWSVTSGTMVDTSSNGKRHYGHYKGGQNPGQYAVVATGNPGNVSDTAIVTVTPVPVAALNVAPAAATIAVGATIQLVATTIDSAGNVLTGRSVNWASGNSGAASVDGNGLVTGMGAGAATITATSEGKSGTASVTVSSIPVASVTVSPASASLTVGQTAQFSATARDANGNALAGRPVTWTSSDGAMASVSGSGRATGVAAGGPVTITATSEGQSGAATVTVANAPVASVTVAPATASVATGQTVQLSATPTDANGNPLTGRVITWASSDNTIASVNGSGLVTGVAAGGPVTITATSEGKSGTASITVRTASSGPLPVFPGAMGFGTTTAAGRGGAILRVTNLNDAGAGSLRAALEATGPRAVIFEVGGMIDLSDDIYITSPYLTVADQTAPSPGITLRYAGLQIQTHDVLVQHLRIQVGDLVTPPSLGPRDCIQIQNQSTPPYNVVIDHVSLSWNTDKNMSTWYTLHDVTISHSIIAEPLWSSRSQNYNLLIGDYSTNVTVLGNLFAHADERNPYAKGATSSVVVNNLIYDPGILATTFSDYDNSGGPILASVVGNVLIPGPSTTDSTLVSIVAAGGFPLQSGSGVYMKDNLAPALSYVSSGYGWAVAGTPPVPLSGLTVLS